MIKDFDNWMFKKLFFVKIKQIMKKNYLFKNLYNFI